MGGIGLISCLFPAS